MPKKHDYPPEALVPFALRAIKDLDLSEEDVQNYLARRKTKCGDCGCYHLVIDRFCPECGIIAERTYPKHDRHAQADPA